MRKHPTVKLVNAENFKFVTALYCMSNNNKILFLTNCAFDIYMVEVLFLKQFFICARVK